MKNEIRENIEGLTIKQLAEKYGMSYEAVRYLNPKNRPERYKRKLTETQRQEIQENADGLKTAALMEKYGVSRNIIQTLHPKNLPTNRKMTPELIEENAEGLAEKYGISKGLVRTYLLENPKNLLYYIPGIDGTTNLVDFAKELGLPQKQALVLLREIGEQV